ncbi:unnamed protein product [Rotaria magnacalcarata]|uniref:FLYWCH-type domain-containing protein n=2 Tax=Rotaria magnacalcarata TaxID=392030 RepID=A0A814R6E6_9BILA|nr:unnamed protein product [Rotaria magnacalcarata]CAF4261633.1 unnamed protein product [Rotaria magnacalcarata]CAF4517070.1 unnamed protein product [Rotaria magnacalcarata]
MDTKFAWSTTEKGEKAILYNNYLYHLKRENKNTSSHYVCTFNSCSRSITLKNNVIIKSNAENHNHQPKLLENVQAVFCGLKRRNEVKSSEESIMCRYEQEQAQQRTTRPRKGKYIQDDMKLMLAKKKYIQDEDFDSYQKVLRAISHRYIYIIKDTKDSSDEE